MTQNITDGNSTGGAGGDAQAPSRYYRRSNWFARTFLNQPVAMLTRAGLSLFGTRLLEVPGHLTGRPRRVPVNLLTFEGEQYLVSTRGNSHWVRNLRAAGGELDLLLGRSRQHYRAHEIGDEEKVPVLRAYLRRWKAEVRPYFDGAGPDSPDEELLRIAPRHPAFRLEPVRPAAGSRG